METIFEIVRVIEFGSKECTPEECTCEQYSTKLLYRRKEDAIKKAEELLKEHNTDTEKNNWCSVQFIVEKRIVY
jgi:hypothetical protein